jgi:hypothetical protein
MHRKCWFGQPPEISPRHPNTCHACSISDCAKSDIATAIEARLARAIGPSELSWLVEEVGWARCNMVWVNMIAESTRRAIKAKRQRRAEMAVLEAAIKLMERRYPPDDWEYAHPDLIAPVETTIRKLKRELGSTARSSLDVTSTLRFAIRRAGLEHAAHLDSRMNKKLALEVLVHHLTKAWLELADEAFDQLRIGHPDHPGPFLKFLSASADGMPGGITLNSLHAKARELAGRRG